MARIIPAFLVLCASFISSRCSPAQPPAVGLSLSSSAEGGFVGLNETVVFTAAVRNSSEQPVKATLKWSVQTVAFDVPQSRSVHLEIKGTETELRSYVLPMTAVGFAEVQCSIAYANDRTFSQKYRVGTAPELVLSELTKESDFDRFWKGSLAELKTIDPDFEFVPQPDRGTEKTDVFEVTMRSHGDIHVRGWLQVPKSEGPHPAVIRVPGYGSNMKPLGEGRDWDDIVVFSFNPRAHGNSMDEVPGKPVDYWIRGLDDKSTYYYRGAYLDCVRAVDFICSRADVDKKRIAVWGGSQGGGFAFATAALDPRIDFCAADIPFMCDWVNYFRLTVWPEMDKWIADSDNRSWESTLRTLSYFDTMNMADRIQCRTVMGVGLQDAVCPPSTSFAAYNRVPGQKSFKVYADKGHGLGPAHRNRVWQQIRTAFELPIEE
ncbi:MAG: acetylxylan esterase [Fuerstiella sp.]|nr:acetylxylan esterase [Fuerstiella sp.]MCP4509739.1 acetylxylan esterase [Fuerstiella sp.]MDG2129697.1 acetylxylan esterase [Fuerstiella sp.]